MQEVKHYDAKTMHKTGHQLMITEAEQWKYSLLYSFLYFHFVQYFIN